ERLEIDLRQGIELPLQLTLEVEHVDDSAAHAGREVLTHRAEDDRPSSGHVFAAMVADTFDHRVCARVATAESLADHTLEERFTSRRAVEKHVAGDDVLGRLERRIGRGANDHATAGETLAGIVVRITLDADLDASGKPGAETLTRRPLELDLDRSVGESLEAVLPRHLGAEDGADRPIGVLDRQLDAHLFAPRERRLGELEELHVERL